MHLGRCAYHQKLFSKVCVMEFCKKSAFLCDEDSHQHIQQQDYPQSFIKWSEVDQKVRQVHKATKQKKYQKHNTQIKQNLQNIIKACAIVAQKHIQLINSQKKKRNRKIQHILQKYKQGKFEQIHGSDIYFFYKATSLDDESQKNLEVQSKQQVYRVHKLFKFINKIITDFNSGYFQEEQEIQQQLRGKSKVEQQCQTDVPQQNFDASSHNQMLANSNNIICYQQQERNEIKRNPPPQKRKIQLILPPSVTIPSQIKIGKHRVSEILNSFHTKINNKIQELEISKEKQEILEKNRRMNIQNQIRVYKEKIKEEPCELDNYDKLTVAYLELGNMDKAGQYYKQGANLRQMTNIAKKQKE